MKTKPNTYQNAKTTARGLSGRTTETGFNSQQKEKNVHGMQQNHTANVLPRPCSEYACAQNGRIGGETNKETESAPVRLDKTNGKRTYSK